MPIIPYVLEFNSSIHKKECHSEYKEESCISNAFKILRQSLRMTNYLFLRFNISYLYLLLFYNIILSVTKNLRILGLVQDDNSVSYTKASNACFKSAIISSADSRPTDNLTNPSAIPLSALSSGV